MIQFRGSEVCVALAAFTGEESRAANACKFAAEQRTHGPLQMNSARADSHDSQLSARLDRLSATLSNNSAVTLYSIQRGLTLAGARLQLLKVGAL